MSGVPKAMFLPLSLSIAFAMIVSFVAAQTLVPVISNWLLKAEMYSHAHAGLALDNGEINEVNAHNKEEQHRAENNNFFLAAEGEAGQPPGRNGCRRES